MMDTKDIAEDMKEQIQNRGPKLIITIDDRNTPIHLINNKNFTNTYEL
jgi:hypothetical protein